MKKVFMLFTFVMFFFVFISCNEKITINVSEKEVTIEVGSSYTVNATVNEGNILTWSSSDETIITVNNGLIEAIKVGNATITVSVENNEKISETISVTVIEKSVEYEITVSDEYKNISLEVGETKNLVVNATNNAELVYLSSDEEVVKVNAGVVEGLKKGTATITVSIKDTSKSVTINVTVNEKIVETITINDDDKEIELPIYSYRNIDAVSSLGSELVFKSSDESIVSVYENEIEALAFGEVTITICVKDNEEIFETIKVKVVNPLTESIEVKYANSIIKIGDQEQLELVITPSGASEKLNWEFDPINIVSVDENNLLTALNAGVVSIKAIATDGSGKFYEYKIRVVGFVDDIEIEGLNRMIPDSTQTLKATIKTTMATSELEFTSTNPSVATVDDKGFVHALSIGTTVIKVKALDKGGYTKEFPIEVGFPVTEVLVDKSVENLQENTEIIWNGIKFYAKKTAFQTIQEALEYATHKVYITNGEYNESFTIAKDNITIFGDIDTTITGVITVGANVKNATIERIIMTGNARIITDNAGGQDGLLIYNVLINGSTVDASMATIHMQGDISNVRLINNKVINNKAGRLFKSDKSITNLYILNNTFEDGGTTYDWIRLEGKTFGQVTISDNTFKKSLQSGIFMKTHDSATYEIINNKFYDMANVAIDIRVGTAKCVAKFVIKYNLLDNTNVNVDDIWNPIRLRFNGHTMADVTCNINFNAYINWGTTFLEDPESAKLKCVNMDYNYFDGLKQSQLKDSNFDNIAMSYLNAFETIEELNSYIQFQKVNEYDNYLVVGSHPIVTRKTYKTIQEAIDASEELDTIIVLPGTYKENFTINKNLVYLYTLNADNNPNEMTSRVDETIIDGTITLDKNVVYTVIKGFKFINNSQIINVIGTVGTASATTTNIDYFQFENNIVESGLEGKNGFFATTEAGSSYSHGIEIINNHFTSTSTFSSKAMLYIDNNYDLKISGNVFENINATYAVYIHDTTKGLSGQLSIISDNKFINVKGTSIHINWLSPLPLNTNTAVVEVENNQFTNIETGVYFGSMNNADIYKAIKVNYNVFNGFVNGFYFNRVHSKANIISTFNKFMTVPSGYYYNNNSKNSSTSDPADLNAKDNLYMDNGKVITPDSTKFIGEVIKTTSITSEDDLPTSTQTAQSIQIQDVELFVGDSYQLEVQYTPKNITNTGVVFSSSDLSVATVTSDGMITCLKAGTVTIKCVYTKDPKVFTELTLNIEDFREVSLSFESDGVLEVGEEFDISAKIVGQNTVGELVFESSDESVLVVVDGKVKALKNGIATITCKIEGSEIQTSFDVLVSPLDDVDALLKLLANGNNAYVWYNNIDYYGYETGYTKAPNQVYSAVNKYYASALPEITENMLPTNRENYSGKKISKIELITIHDTGAASPAANAKSQSSWCTNATNSSTSWHYTIGNDGLFKQLPDDIIGWHAGDGSEILSGTIDTGIKAKSAGYRPTVTIEDGYYVFDGVKSTCEAPKVNDRVAKTEDIVDSGIVTLIKENGNYWINTYYNKTYGKIANYGGASSIGIETAVNSGSDVYLTWQRTAKFAASLLVKYDLTLDRIVQHNNLSGKNCPQTMRTAGLFPYFMEMVALEYTILKDYSDYTITFKSNNPDIIDDSGRVVGNGPYRSTKVSYTITVSKDDESKSITLYSLVQGSLKH